MRRVVFTRHRADHVAQIRDLIGILDHDLIRAVLAQIGKLAEHLVRGFEVQRRLIVRVAKALSRHQDAAERLVLRLEEVHVAGRTIFMLFSFSSSSPETCPPSIRKRLFTRGCISR